MGTKRTLGFALARSNPIGVDREAGIIRGMVLAESGPFKTPGRGEFDAASLSAIATLINKEGSVRSRFGHASALDHGPGKFLGRVSNARVDGNRVRGDLTFSRTASNLPGNGDVAGYIMALVEEDPELGISTSLVLEADEEFRLNKDGTQKEGKNGEVAPPLWRPLQIFASDIVDEGDAVHAGILAAMGKQRVAHEADRMLEAAIGLLKRFDANLKVDQWVKSVLDRQYGCKSPASQVRIDKYMLQKKKLTTVTS